MLDVVKTLFQPKLLFYIGFMILYTAGMVAALNAANIWTVSLLKDTILWFCFAGVVLTFRFVTATNNVNVFSTIVIVDVVASTDEKHSAVAKLTGRVNATIGLAILVFATTQAVSDYRSLNSIDTVKSFLLAPVLSILFSPFIYIVTLVATYEIIFVRLNMGLEKERALKQYAKRQIIVCCGLSLKRARGFLTNSGLDVMRIRSRSDVDAIMRDDRSQ